jgi:hypothetical protein
MAAMPMPTNKSGYAELVKAVAKPAAILGFWHDFISLSLMSKV